jgi:hypothetical protein
MADNNAASPAVFIDDSLELARSLYDDPFY